MSTPRSLDLPAGVHRVEVATARGPFAALEARADAAVSGHVLLVPGFTGSKEDFSPLLPLLARSGWHATAYDQRGQWETSGGPGVDYTLGALAADALAVRAAVADAPRSVVVGHSFGGLVAQHAVLADPSVWDATVLLCSGPGAFAGAQHLRQLAAFRRAVPRMGLERVFERRQAGAAPVTPAVRAFLRRRFVSGDERSLLAIAAHLADAPDRVDELARVGVPVRVVRGVDDDAWPHADQDQMASRLGTEVIVVPGAAHSPAVENPAGLAAALLPLLPD